MKTFNVYHHPTRGYDAVKQGFSWPGFLFSGVWALVKRLWMIGALVLGTELVLWIVGALADKGGEAATGLLASLISASLSFVCGFMGNGWRNKALEARGYVQRDIVTAASVDAAIATVARAAEARLAGRAAA